MIDYIDFIKELKKEKPTTYINILSSKKYKDVYDFIVSKTPLLNDPFYKLSTKICWILNGYTEFPKCMHCGKEMKFRNVYNEYPMYCCQDCGRRSKLTQLHREESCLKKHNVKNIAQVPETWKTIESTNIKKYGVKCSLHAPRVKEKVSKIFHDKFGGNASFCDINVRMKSEDTLEKRTGFRNASQVREYRLKQACKYFYDDVWFSSSWELAYYIYLVDNKIEFEFQPLCDITYEFNGKTHHYYPDFLVDGKYIDIKGDQFFENGKMICPWDRSFDALQQARYECMIRNNVILLKQKEITPYLKYIKEKYGNNYLDSFKKKRKVEESIS